MLNSSVGDTERDVDGIVAICVEQIEAGQATVESCLAQYPDLAAELELPLRMIGRLLAVSASDMHPAAIQRLETRLLSRTEELKREQVRTGRKGISTVIARLASAMAVIVLLLILGSGAWVVSANSLPGHPLYPVKRASENVQMALTGDPVQRATLHATFALRRLGEAVRLNKQEGRWHEDTLQEMTRELEDATGQVTQGGGTGSRATWEYIAGLTLDGEREVEEADVSDEPARQAVEVLRRIHSRAMQELDEEHEGETEHDQPKATLPPSPDTKSRTADTKNPGRQPEKPEKAQVPESPSVARLDRDDLTGSTPQGPTDGEDKGRGHSHIDLQQTPPGSDSGDDNGKDRPKDGTAEPPSKKDPDQPETPAKSRAGERDSTGKQGEGDKGSEESNLSADKPATEQTPNVESGAGPSENKPTENTPSEGKDNLDQGSKGDGGGDNQHDSGERERGND